MIPAQLCKPEFRFIKVIKNEKLPAQKSWQLENNFSFNDEELIKWIQLNQNYGLVLSNRTIIIDADDEPFISHCKNNMPETFTVKTRKGFHYYFRLKDNEDYKHKKAITTLDKKHCGDFLTNGHGVSNCFVMCPNSIHPSGARYEVFQDSEIKEITISELENILGDFSPIEKPQQKIKEIPIFTNHKYGNDLIVPSISTILNLSNFHDKEGNKYQGAHPVHDSEGGCNFAFDLDKNVWYCFRHARGGSFYELLAIQEGIIDCGDTDKLRGDKFKSVLKVARDKGLIPDDIGLTQQEKADKEVLKFQKQNADYNSENDLSFSEYIKPFWDMTLKESNDTTKTRMKRLSKIIHRLPGNDTTKEAVWKTINSGVYAFDDNFLTELKKNMPDDFDSYKPKKIKPQFLVKKDLEDVISEILYVYALDLFKCKTIRNDRYTEIFIYNRFKGIYAENGLSYISSELQDILGHKIDVSLFNRVIFKIKAGSFIDSDVFYDTKNTNKHLICLENGVFDIEQKKLLPHSHEYNFISQHENITYDEKAECPNFDRFIGDILEDENDKKLIYEIFGYCLYRDVPIQKQFFFFGSGANGKSTLLNILSEFISSENIARIELEDIVNKQTPFIHESLFRKSANISGDIKKTIIMDDSTLRGYSGGDYVTIHRKFKSDVQYKPYLKMIFSCNDLPVFLNPTPATIRRNMLIKFPFSFKSEFEYEKAEDKTNLKIADIEIVKSLTTKKELSGMFNKSMKALDHILEKGDFTRTKSDEETFKEIQKLGNSFYAFCNDCIEYEFNSFITVQDLYYAYCEYRNENKLNGLNEKAIFNFLQKEYGVTKSKIRTNSNRFIENNRRITQEDEYEQPYCFNNIQLNQSAYLKYSKAKTQNKQTLEGVI